MKKDTSFAAISTKFFSRVCELLQLQGEDLNRILLYGCDEEKAQDEKTFSILAMLHDDTDDYLYLTYDEDEVALRAMEDRHEYDEVASSIADSVVDWQLHNRTLPPAVEPKASSTIFRKLKQLIVINPSNATLDPYRQFKDETVIPKVRDALDLAHAELAKFLSE